jgi:photolyase PhrII
MSPESLKESLPPHLRERVDPLGTSLESLSGEFVLYWMRTAVRGHENPALDVALHAAHALGFPLFVYHAVSERYPYASDRHHTFILEGARDVAEELAGRGIGYALHVERPGHRGPHLKNLAERAVLVVTEDMPVAPLRGWTERLSQAIAAPVWQVDAAAVCPMLVVGQVFGSAGEFERVLSPLYAQRVPAPWLEVSHEGPPFVPEDLGFEAVDPQSMDIPTLVAQCEIDHGIGPVPETPGGSVAGYGRWGRFLAEGLGDYHRKRSNPVADGASRMSAYLHYGHVSPFLLAREAMAAGGDGSEKFLNELLVWRDLSYSLCKWRPHHDQVSALPTWARDTLEAHESDPRDALPSWETLSRGRSGDDLWDLAQASLLAHGELHNNVRMTWAKALPRWTADIESALALALDLNHRFALDGRDPNSYQGILWCFGLFDRPHEPERPIMGTVRARDTAWQSTMIDMPGYRRRVRRPLVDEPPRVVVVGAGVAGLSCARVLHDHQVPVRLLDKARGPGGRISTRRADDLRFDHGAQFFSSRDPRFRIFVDAWVHDGHVAPWEGRFGALQEGSFREETDGPVRYVGTPTMSALGRHLAEGLSVTTEARVTSLHRDGGGWVLVGDEGELDRADVVVLALPATQAFDLLQDPHPELAQACATAEMAPCWAVMMAFDEPVGIDLDGATVSEPPIAWLSRDSSKPGRQTPGETWVVHSTAAWAEMNLERSRDEVVEVLKEAFFSALDLPAREASYVAAHRWRFSRSIAASLDGAWYEGSQGIGVCGDWLHGDDLEGGFLSGRAMAGRILGALGSRSRLRQGSLFENE